jgi:hypothetical protein
VHDAELSDHKGWLAKHLLIVLCVVALLLPVLVLLVLAVVPIPPLRRRAVARVTAHEFTGITIALQVYLRDFGAYPPDDITIVGGSSENGPSEVIVYYLCRRHKKGLNLYGPYMEFRKDSLTDEDNDGFEEVRDPLRNLYLYTENASHKKPTGKNPKSYDLVNPGPDGELGGTISPATGYVPATTPAGKAQEKDNVTN